MKWLSRRKRWVRKKWVRKVGVGVVERRGVVGKVVGVVKVD